MIILSNSGGSDKMPHGAAFFSGSALFPKTKRSSENGNLMQYYLEIITCDPSIYTMDYSKFILSNQQEESINTQRVKRSFTVCIYLSHGSIKT